MGLGLKQAELPGPEPSPLEPAMQIFNKVVRNEPARVIPATLQP